MWSQWDHLIMKIIIEILKKTKISKSSRCRFLLIQSIVLILKLDKLSKITHEIFFWFLEWFQ